MFMLSFCDQRRICLLLACALFIAGAMRAETTRFPKQKTTASSASHKSERRASSLSVEVINGTSKRTVILQNDQTRIGVQSTRHKSSVKSRRGHRTATPPSSTAEILNGTQKSTPVFNSTVEPIRNLPPNVIGISSSDARSLQGKSKPVVVGISSSGSASGTSNSHPVVVNIASSESHGKSGDAQSVVVGIASSGSQTAKAVAPVAVGVAPHPAKRHPYRPAALDAQ